MPIDLAMGIERGEPIPKGAFSFGKNWQNFLCLVDEDRIAAAVGSLKHFLGVNDLTGKRFLDIGCGSGLFSLAATRLGAEVRSLDYDPDSVACALELKKRYGQPTARWTIEQGSVLDRSYIQSLGSFDVVYSWGVLHHTGAMWEALDNAQLPLPPGGLLWIAIYNDQGGASRRWTAIKRCYNRSSKPMKLLLASLIGVFFELRSFGRRMAKFQNPLPFKEWSQKKKDRGMSVWHDLVDWVGGYPFEVAKPEDMFDFYQKRNFVLMRLKTCGGGLGCNEFLFKKL